MSQSLTVNGTVYAFPTNLETNWGTVVTNWASAVSSHTLQKTGGTFTLSAEVNFGATYGLIAAYYKTRGTTLSSTGVLRMANTEFLGWRNAANTADLELGVDVSDNLTFNGIAILPSTALTASRALISSAAGLVSVSAVTATELGYVSGVTSALQTQIDAKASTVALNDHINDAVAAHAASAISSAPLGNLAAATVQAALDELQSDIDTRATTTALSDHISDAVAAHAASAISSAPLGNLAATTVQGALDELQTDVDGRVPASTATTKGDILVRDASSIIRLAVGSNGQALVADSAEISGIKWGTQAAPNLNVVSKTAAYTLLTTDDVVLASASAGAFTLTLPTAVGNTGKTFRIKKTDSTLTAVTVDGNGTETIDGSATTTIDTQNEALTIVSDGSNWIVIERRIPSNVVTFTPTGSWVSNCTYTGRWWRIGNRAHFEVKIVLSAGNAEAAMTVNLPTGITVATADLVDVDGNITNIDSGSWARDASVGQFFIYCTYNNTTTVAVRDMLASGTYLSTNNAVSSSVPFTNALNDKYILRFSVPVSGWSAG